MADLHDLALPSHIPEIKKYQTIPMNVVPFALYTLIDISPEALKALQELCNKEAREEDDELSNDVRPPPRSNFAGRPLQAIVDYHVELARGGEFHATLFVVCVHRDWEANGVLLVTLDDDDLECKPDKFLEEPEQACLTLLNLQISNINWEEAKRNAKFSEVCGDDE